MTRKRELLTPAQRKLLGRVATAEITGASIIGFSADPPVKRLLALD